MYLGDNRQAWELRPDGKWQQRTPVGVTRASHELLLVNSWGIVEGGTGAGLWDETAMGPRISTLTQPNDGRPT